MNNWMMGGLKYNCNFLQLDEILHFQTRFWWMKSNDHLLQLLVEKLCMDVK